MARSPWFGWNNTTTHHDLHHQTGRYNFGLYFTWWDRACGTEHPQYRARLRALVDGMEQGAPVDERVVPR